MATTDTVDERVAPGMSGLALAGFGALLMCLAAGYGVLFTIVDDYRDEYGISETAIGVVIGRRIQRADITAVGNSIDVGVQKVVVGGC